MDAALARNQATARKLIWVPAVVLGAIPAVVLLVILAVTVPLLTPLALLVGVAIAMWLANRIRQGGPTATLGRAGGHPVTATDEPRLHNLVDGLCVGIGLQPPRLHVIEDDAPNALAVARSVDDADLVVTRGLLARLSRVELEAVLAHELARIRRGDAVVGALVWVSLAAPPAGLVAPITRRLAGADEPVEAWTDLAAVDITRYPPALASALQKLAGDPNPVPAAADPAVAHLWIHGAKAEGAVGQALVRVYEPVPPVAQRIEVLEEL